VGIPPAASPRARAARLAALPDAGYGAVLAAGALAVPLLLAGTTWALARGGLPTFATRDAWDFLTRAAWDPVRGVFAVGPALGGTLVTAALALALAAPLGLAAAVYTAELAPPRLRTPLAALVDLLAAVPSVVYGLWGLHVLVPAVRTMVGPFLRDTLGLGRLPAFAGPAYGPSVLAASLVLAVMVLPYVAAVSREVLRAVPAEQREAALALGATPWEAAVDVVLPHARAGVVGAVLLGLGRALGETMAVAMVIGAAHRGPGTLLAPGYTLASLIANEFAEAGDDRHLAALLAAGLALFAVTLVVNAIARWLVGRVSRPDGADGMGAPA
jgi:phosphate transport system permease protein